MVATIEPELQIAHGPQVQVGRRGGPRLVGEPGTRAFGASDMAAIAARRAPEGNTFHSVVAGYKASQDFQGLKPRTKADYLKLIPRIEKQFGDLPLAALDDARVTRDFLEWRDGMASSPRQADYCWMVLMRLLSWARARGLTLYRPPERVERLYHADRSEKIWSEPQIAAFMGVASEPLQRAQVLALETGQRQGDLLTLPWSAYDGTPGQDRTSSVSHLKKPFGYALRNRKAQNDNRFSAATKTRDTVRGKRPASPPQKGVPHNSRA